MTLHTLLVDTGLEIELNMYCTPSVCVGVRGSLLIGNINSIIHFEKLGSLNMQSVHYQKIFSVINTRTLLIVVYVKDYKLDCLMNKEEIIIVLRWLSVRLSICLSVCLSVAKCSIINSRLKTSKSLQTVWSRHWTFVPFIPERSDQKFRDLIITFA